MMTRLAWPVLIASLWWCEVAYADPTAAMHPPVTLLDRDGTQVLQSGQPISTMRTCGVCHDTQYIAAHSYHATAGFHERFGMGSRPESRAWDHSPGQFGRWNVLLYRYASPPGDRKLDLGVAEWIQRFGARHVGGGPAVTGYGNTVLDDRIASPGSPVSTVDPDQQILDPLTRQVQPWDWQASGVAEMNCFLCHAARPDNLARVDELRAGRFRWASTATLQGTGIVRKSTAGWQYVAESFQPDGTLAATTLGIQAPASEHCGQCHGQTHFGDEPLRLDTSWRAWSTLTKGQIFSPQLLSDSALNLAGKSQLSRAWDVHAAAMLECTSCHFALNDPKSYEPSHSGRPRHLRYEPRRLDIGEFLTRPSHQFAKGATAQGTVARHLSGTMRGCADCHDAEHTHEWLPYRDVHFARLSCEACHIARVYAPALREIDWTIVTPDGQPRQEWRGVDGDPRRAAAQVIGYEPVLLPRQELDGTVRLVPHNLLTAWYWVENGAQPRPVRLADLQAALLDGDRYHPAVLAALDTNRNGSLEPTETRLDAPEKVAMVRERLLAVGVSDPRIQGETQPFGIHHGVGPAHGATQSCDTCHATNSRLARPLVLASRTPADVQPQLVRDAGVSLAGQMRLGAHGELVYQPETRAAQLYVLGHDRWVWVNWLGTLALLGVVLSVAVHTGLRIRASRPSRTRGADAVHGTDIKEE